MALDVTVTVLTEGKIRRFNFVLLIDFLILPLIKSRKLMLESCVFNSVFDFSLKSCQNFFSRAKY